MSDLPPPGPVAETDSYDNEPYLVRTGGDDLLCVYRRASAHVSDDGRLVARRSGDRGHAWTDPVVVFDHPDLDTRNQSAFRDPETGLVTVLCRTLDTEAYRAEGAGQGGLYAVHSEDGGRTWSEPAELGWRDQTARDQYVPFGGGVRTDRGLLTALYGSDGAVRVRHSEDGGRTWDEPVEVLSRPGHGEPVPCAYDEERVLLVGRQNDTAEFWAVRSDDAGETWGAPAYFRPGRMDRGTPLWAAKTGPNRLTAAWGDRTDGTLYTVSASANLVWQDPAALADLPREPLHRMLAAPDRTADFGYPTLARFGRDVLIAFYDGSDGAPDVWLCPLP